jgi:hypothetical protein
VADLAQTAVRKANEIATAPALVSHMAARGSEEPPLPALTFPGLARSAGVVFGVIRQVAALAERREIVICTMLRRVIQVGHCQHDPNGPLALRIAANTARADGMNPEYFRTLFVANHERPVRGPAPFALLAVALSNPARYLRPIFRISVLVFRSNRHLYR